MDSCCINQIISLNRCGWIHFITSLKKCQHVMQFIILICSQHFFYFYVTKLILTLWRAGLQREMNNDSISTKADPFYFTFSLSFFPSIFILITDSDNSNNNGHLPSLFGDDFKTIRIMMQSLPPLLQTYAYKCYILSTTIIFEVPNLVSSNQKCDLLKVQSSIGEKTFHQCVGPVSRKKLNNYKFVVVDLIRKSSNGQKITLLIPISAF